MTGVYQTFAAAAFGIVGTWRRSATAAWDAEASIALAELTGVIGIAQGSLERGRVAETARTVDAVEIVAVKHLAVCDLFECRPAAFLALTVVTPDQATVRATADPIHAESVGAAHRSARRCAGITAFTGVVIALAFWAAAAGQQTAGFGA